MSFELKNGAIQFAQPPFSLWLYLLLETRLHALRCGVNVENR